MVSLETTVAGIPLKTCVYNASGPRTGSSAALAKIAGSAAGAVLSKSATIESQTGNPQPRTWHSSDDKASMNSEGLPNSGIDYYISKETIDETLAACPDGGTKPYMVSISGKTLKDNLEMLDRISKVQSSIACVELNLACPNIIGKPIIGFDFEQMRMILKTIQEKNYPFKLGVKLPPYLDGKHLSEAASIINEYSKLVRYVVCINTIGNALSIDPVSEAPFIAANNGLAGLSGAACKYTALANVRQMRNQLLPTVDVIGVGGIETGEDVFLFLLCGANAVQVGTCHWKEGPKCFDRICDELKQVLKSKGYSSVQDVIGKLKPWSKEGAALSRAAKKNSSGSSTTAGTKSESSSKHDTEQLKILNWVFFAVICILLADKFGRNQ
jgi:dihydroorotate dehydrogenase (fumarate)